MFRLIAFEPEHYMQAMRGTGNPDNARLWYERGPAWTGYRDDVLLGCGGVAVLHPGVLGEAWAVLTDAGRQHPTWMARTIARGLLSAIRTEGLQRVQADAVAHDARSVKLLERLRFTFESYMPVYGPSGEDFVRMVMFPHHPPPQPLPEGLYEKDGAIWVEGYEHPVVAGGYGTEAIIIMAVLAAAATAVSTYSAVQAGESRAAAARYNRKVALNQAQEAKDRAATEVARQREHANQVLAANRAHMGASGAVSDYGSALLLAQDNTMTAELNAQRAEYTGEVEAVNYLRRAQGLSMEAQQATTAGYLTAGSTALSGASSMLRTYGSGPGVSAGGTNLLVS
jgi:hypothetical protein